VTLTPMTERYTQARPSRDANADDGALHAGLVPPSAMGACA
jgi:hypothetical protein